MPNLFSTPKAPIIPPPKPIPDLGDTTLIEAKKKALLVGQQRTGRANTILTDGTKDKFGG